METVYFGQLFFQVWEFALLPFYFLLIWFISSWIKNMNIGKYPEYKYYVFGLYSKILGGTIFGLIYVYYYQGGDTINYFQSAVAFSNLFDNSVGDFFTVWLAPASEENLSYFNMTIGYPLRYLYFDIKTYTVIRITAPLAVITFKSYLLSTVLLSWISYFGIWRLFQLFCQYYPVLTDKFAIAILFIPSVVFWGSGILKDTITLSAACWFVYAFHNIFIRRKKMIFNIIYMFIAFYFLVSIKPYIVNALLPGLILWGLLQKIKNIKNQFVSIMITPVIFISSIGAVFILLSFFGGMLQEFSPDNIMEKAAVTQEDLSQEYYGGNSFDIGQFEASPTGVLSKIPIAVTSGIYRPFLWETGNIVMLISGLENTILMILTFWVLIKMRFYNLVKLFRILWHQPFLFFCLSYSIIFAFGVGLTTANFGALVRFKIPFLPFFVAGLFICIHQLNFENKNKKIQGFR